MLKNDLSSIFLTAATVENIMAAAHATRDFNPAIIETLQSWLSNELEQAFRRAQKRPLTKLDVERLMNAYQKFSTVIDGLQDRNLAPPRIPVSDGFTPWENWLETYYQFGYVRGRREGSDWLLIGALLAVYEIVSTKPASAAQPEGPTMRFLRTAFSELTCYVPKGFGSNFEPPTVEALRKKLPNLNRLALWSAKRRLLKLVEQTGE